MNPRVMLVQDDADLFDQLREHFPAGDGQLAWAQGDGHALELIEDSEFDVLIVDLDLRSGTAWNTLADLVTLDPLVRVVLISSSPGWQSLGASVGADAVLEKPLDVLALVRLLREFACAPSSRVRPRAEGADLNEDRLTQTNVHYLQWLRERRLSVWGWNSSATLTTVGE